MSHTFFVSYAAEDSPAALFFCDALEKNGFPCWIAPRDVSPAVEYGEVIVVAVESNKVLVVLLSASANASRFVMREVSLALESGISILPIRLQDVQPARSLKFFLQGLHRLDAFPEPLTDHLPRVIIAIRALARESSVIEEDQGGDPEPVGGSGSVKPVDEAERDAAAVARKAVEERGLTPSSINNNLLIFSTRKQKTWLSFTRFGVVCVLDNRAKGGRISAQWFEPLANIDAFTVSARDRQGKPGLLRIGSHTNWLYTKALFGSGDHLKEKILAEVQRSRK